MRSDHTIMKSITIYPGLYVHKDSITIAIAEFGPKGELRIFGTITNDLHALERAVQTRIATTLLVFLCPSFFTLAYEE
jgi:hypothetical protein